MESILGLLKLIWSDNVLSGICVFVLTHYINRKFSGSFKSLCVASAVAIAVLVLVRTTLLSQDINAEKAILMANNAQEFAIKKSIEANNALELVERANKEKQDIESKLAESSNRNEQLNDELNKARIAGAVAKKQLESKKIDSERAIQEAEFKKKLAETAVQNATPANDNPTVDNLFRLPGVFKQNRRSTQ